MRAQKFHSRRSRRGGQIHRVSGAAASRRRHTGSTRSKSSRNPIGLAILVIVAIALLIVIFQKPEVSESEFNEEIRAQRMLEDLKRQNPESEVFLLEGTN